MTSYNPRIIPSTTYTNPVRPWILDYYSWLSAPDSWENANLSWDSYGSWPQATTYGERIIPTTIYWERTVPDTNYSERTIPTTTYSVR